jgi:hypothetical protein
LRHIVRIAERCDQLAPQVCRSEAAAGWKLEAESATVLQHSAQLVQRRAERGHVLEILMRVHEVECAITVPERRQLARMQRRMSCRASIEAGLTIDAGDISIERESELGSVAAVSAPHHQHARGKPLEVTLYQARKRGGFRAESVARGISTGKNVNAHERSPLL